MSDQGKANYEAYRKTSGPLLIADEIDPEYEKLPANMRHGFDAGADAVEAWLAEAPVDEDAPGSEPKPAKAIVVTEMPFGDGAPVQKRYGANQTDTSPYGQLRLLRKGTEVAVYQSSAWLSVREDGALVPDSTHRALEIGRRALLDILKRSEDYDQPFGRPEISDAARDALEEIFTETEL